MENYVLRLLGMLLPLLLVLTVANVTGERVSVSAEAISPDSGPVVIVDAGHGGEDGGAVGIGDVQEKDLNLSIALKTADQLRFFGYTVLVTRTTDQMTCDDGLPTLRQRKKSDIQNRLTLLEETENAFLISIHQNFFGGYAKGAQIFYSGNNPESKTIAQIMQDAFASMLQPENERLPKKATTDIYLLYKATRPAVMAECGFLSNGTDIANLTDSGYQSRIAFVISCAMTDYFGGGQAAQDVA
ncbi:MAG TPA: N-acetylmuramoyl-L-alanine amidase [Oscillospiraceae bacterium]|nr:N-acetylmuramoyl-L-alanine amidase [Oscillospiraceae bacterium]